MGGKMTIRFEQAKSEYEQLGVDVETVLNKLSKVAVSMHCWQGDDVLGFDGSTSLSGGIQTTGNYPGRARTPQELMADIDFAFKHIPGQKRLNLHASYAIFEEGEVVDRDQLEPKHFKAWVHFAKVRDIKLDFNPTYFSHPKATSFTLASEDEAIREFWIQHTIACLRISEYFARELNSPCVMNIWIPDGLKDLPADRLGPRKRFMESLDKALSVGYDKELVKVCLESKVFGIGMESYTVGSSEFTTQYVLSRHLIPLLDNGHYHPTESVADKLSSLLLFNPELVLHITRPVRWDSDHVVLFDDVTKEILSEVIAMDALDKVYLASDFFDASINRVAAWIIGMRNIQKGLLYGLLMPHRKLLKCQESHDFTQLLMLHEELKTLPFDAIWKEYCQRQQVIADLTWFDDLSEYERKTQLKRG